MRRLYAAPLLTAAALLVVAPAAPVFAQDDPKAVAVLRFDNDTGDPKYDNLGRGLASMMISDLSVLAGVQLVERQRLEELQQELDFQQSPYADPASAQQMGMFVGAEFVVTGAFMSLEPDMRLDTRIVRVESSEIMKTAEVAGPRDQLFELQQRLADEFIDGLDLVLTAEDRERLRAQQEANRMSSIEAVLGFSTALCLADNGYYVEAFEQIQEVRESDPGSGVVGATLELLRERAEDEAKNRLVEEAGRRIGGLFGRSREPQRTSNEDAGC
ncbi:MAG: CsgG/HfaB family protein [Longimicrobiales bacterium]